MKIIFYVLFICSVFALPSCNSIGTRSDSLDPVDLTFLITPEPSKSIIQGQLINMDGRPFEGMTVRLARVYRENNEGGAFVLDEANSPLSLTDSNGEYQFLNIDPGEYVLFVGSLNDRYKIVSGPDENPNIYSVRANEVLEIETIVVEFD